MKNGSFTIMLSKKGLGESGTTFSHQKPVFIQRRSCSGGILYYELLPNNETINSEKYCFQLDELKTIEQKCPEIANRKGVVFHQDNARPHMSLITRQKLLEFSWDVFPIHHIHQTSRPLIFTYFDHYKIPLMEKASTLWSR